jgi:hypothetical protein
MDRTQLFVRDYNKFPSTVHKAVKKPVAIKKTLLSSIDDPTVTQVVPSAVEKRIERNKRKYGRRIDQFVKILENTDYIPNGSTKSYHTFILDMYKALIRGRKITPKMESAITNIVKKYAKWLKVEKDPKSRQKKYDFIEESVSKIHMIKRLLNRAGYTDIYKSRSEYFLHSVENQVVKKGRLSVKQRKALNSMYKRFDKKVKNKEKVEKRVSKELKKMKKSEKKA